MMFYLLAPDLDALVEQERTARKLEELLARIPAIDTGHLTVDIPEVRMWAPVFGWPEGQGSGIIRPACPQAKLGVSLPVHTTETQAEAEVLQALPDLSSLVSMEEPASTGPEEPVEHAAVASASDIGPHAGQDVGSGASDCEDSMPTACGPSPLRLSKRNISAADFSRSLSGALSGVDSDIRAEMLGPSFKLPATLGHDDWSGSAEPKSSESASPRNGGVVLSTSISAGLPLPIPYPKLLQRQLRSSISRVRLATDLPYGVSSLDSSGLEPLHVDTQPELCGGSHGARRGPDITCSATDTAFCRQAAEETEARVLGVEHVLKHRGRGSRHQGQRRHGR